jgi:hypothetical protein
VEFLGIVCLIARDLRQGGTDGGVGKEDAWAESVLVGGLSLRSLSLDRCANAIILFFLMNFLYQVNN